MLKKRNNYLYLITGTVSVLMLTTILLHLHTYPFGDKLFLWADADQNLGFYSYLRTLTEGNDIFYSLNGLFGSNEFSSLAFFAFSPFNILFILFPKHFIAVTHFVAYSKIILSSITFLYFLSQIEPKHYRVAKVVLSISYAFMGYTIFYGWHAAWLDAVMVLPLIVAGLYRLVYEKKYLLYILSLAYGIIAQYYLGFMLGIASALFFCFLLFVRFAPQAHTCKNFFISANNTLLRYCSSTIIAVCISSIVLIPAFLGIPKFRKNSPISQFFDMQFSRYPYDVLSGIFTGQQNSLWDNSPLIYVGIIPIALVIIYFLNTSAKTIEKIGFAVLLFIMSFSFINSFANLFWHGLSQNSWFNFRYSFIMSFLLLYIAFESIRNIQNTELPKTLAKAFVIIFIFFLIVTSFTPGKNIGLLISWDIFSLAFTTLICLYSLSRQTNYSSNILTIAIIIQVVVSLLLNSISIVQVQKQFTKAWYEDTNSRIAGIHEYIQRATPLYRTEVAHSASRANAHLFNYHGITNYSSAENKEVVDFSENLGMISDWMQAGYDSNMPFSAESLVGLKYVLTDDPHNKPYELVKNINNKYAMYENPYTLPIIFEQKSPTNFETQNPFTTINTLYQTINSRASIFAKNTYSIINTQTSQNDGKTLDTTTVEITPVSTGSVYIFIPKMASSISIQSNRKNTKFKPSPMERTYYLGNYNAGETIQVSVTLENQKLTKDNFTSYTENAEAVKNVLSNVKKDVKLEEKSSSRFDIEYTGSSKYLSMTIPFDESWTITDNGKRVQPVRNWNVFMSIPLDQSNNTHHIEMKYTPRGLKLGIVFFSLGIAGLVGMLIYTRRTRKK